MGQMNPLFQYSHQNQVLAPYALLDQYVATVATAVPMNPQGMIQAGQRTPSMAQFSIGQSPGAAHLNLPDGSGMMGSPASVHMQAPGMAHQPSQQGTSSSGPSANTSPNASNKRRRPSVKTEDEAMAQANGVQPRVKPSPKIGGKRQKANPA